MLAPITHFIPAASFRRERLMPAGGRIIARRGQQVNPIEIVAEAILEPQHVLLDISRGLGLTQKEADHYIQHRAGDEVGEGDVIAGPIGIGRRVVRAPMSGTVVLAGGGQVLMELEGESTELKAGYSGIIADIVGDRGVVLEVTGSLIQGVWGNGKINFGLLNLLAQAPDEPITHGMMDVSLRGSVVMGGICEDEQVLLAAEDLPVRGMVLASMDSALVPVALQVSYPLVLIEGFGKLPMNQDAFTILTSGSMRETSLMAEPWNRITNTRPEVVIALPEGARADVIGESARFTIGQKVRVITPPYKSMVGTLTNLQAGLSVLPSGLRTQTAGVRFTNGEVVQVPLTNIEIVG